MCPWYRNRKNGSGETGGGTFPLWNNSELFSFQILNSFKLSINYKYLIFNENGDDIAVDRSMYPTERSSSCQNYCKATW